MSCRHNLKLARSLLLANALCTDFACRCPSSESQDDGAQHSRQGRARDDADPQQCLMFRIDIGKRADEQGHGEANGREQADTL